VHPYNKDSGPMLAEPGRSALSEQSHEAPAEFTLDQAEPGLIRVLVADDDVVMRCMIVEALQEVGYATTECVDGKELVEALGPWLITAVDPPFDLIISDIRMPWAAGTDVLKMVRFRKMAPPVILITAYLDEVGRNTVDELCPAAVFRKPFMIDDLLSEVRSLVPPA
jgi:CheY-like chemotaxis protein